MFSELKDGTIRKKNKLQRCNNSTNQFYKRDKNDGTYASLIHFAREARTKKNKTKQTTTPNLRSKIGMTNDGADNK